MNDMKSMEDLGFRALHHKLVYIHCPEDVGEMNGSFQVMDGAEGVLTYCFVEKGMGLSFYILRSAKPEGEKLVLGPEVHDQRCRLRYGELEHYQVILEKDLENSASEYGEVISDIHEKFEADDEKLRMIHGLEILDGSRNVEFPDHISVVFTGTGTYPELGWVRCTDCEDGQFKGEVVQPPRQKLGVHFGDEITFRAYEGSDKKIYFIADRGGEMAEKQPEN